MLGEKGIYRAPATVLVSLRVIAVLSTILKCHPYSRILYTERQNSVPMASQ